MTATAPSADDLFSTDWDDVDDAFADWAAEEER